MGTKREPDGNMVGTTKIQYQAGWFGFVDQFIHDHLCVIPCPMCIPKFPESMHDGMHCLDFLGDDFGKLYSERKYLKIKIKNWLGILSCFITSGHSFCREHIL
jgi:hypothetical protein